MRRAASLALLILAACATQQSGSKPPVPEIAITQLSSVAPAARNVTGGVSVQYAVQVRNVDTQPLTLKRVDVNSIGYGAYSVPTQSRAFNVTIAPGTESTVEFWVPAQIVDPSIAGANGPVTMRVVVFFDSPAGPIQTMVTQQVRSSSPD